VGGTTVLQENEVGEANLKLYKKSIIQMGQAVPEMVL
jgi:hypothetical protein